MTPFELGLKNELDIEGRRFANEWLFPWHNINIPHRVVDVDDFQGRRISVGGVRFEGGLQRHYWQAVGRYLTGKSHDTLRSWEEGTRSYPTNLRKSSLEGTSNLLRGFVAATVERAIETDRRLRGRGSPASVQPYNATGVQSHANAEILRLVESHNILIEIGEQKRGLQKFEAIAKRYPGTFKVLTAIVRAVSVFV